MVNRPLISILMTAYNREKYIAEAIESVIASDYMFWELIITDDCSTDATLQIARKYEKHDNRIRVYKNEINLGDYPNRNRAASYAAGEFLMSVDSDDKLLTDAIVKCLTFFEKFPNASFGIFSPYHHEAQLQTPKQIITHHFFERPLLLVGPGGTIIRTKHFKKIGGFPTKYGPANDGYYNIKAASLANTIILPFEFIYYRRHAGQEINNKFSYLYNNYCYLKDALYELNLPLRSDELKYLHKKNKRRFLTNITRFYIKERNWSKTVEAIKNANFNFKDALDGLMN